MLRFSNFRLQKLFGSYNFRNKECGITQKQRTARNCFQIISFAQQAVGSEERLWLVDAPENLTDLTEFAPPPNPRPSPDCWVRKTVRAEPAAFASISRVAVDSNIGVHRGLPEVLVFTTLSVTSSIFTTRGLAVLLPPSTAFTLQQLVSILCANNQFFVRRTSSLVSHLSVNELLQRLQIGPVCTRVIIH